MFQTNVCVSLLENLEFPSSREVVKTLISSTFSGNTVIKHTNGFIKVNTIYKTYKLGKPNEIKVVFMMLQNVGLKTKDLDFLSEGKKRR